MKITGKNLFLEFNGVVWSINSITTDAVFREFEYSDKADTVDVTAGAAGSKTFLTTLSEGDASFKGVFETASIQGSVSATMVPKTYGTLRFGNRGSSTGAQKGVIMAHLIEYKEKIQYDKEVGIDVKFKFDGAWISDPRTATW